MSDNELTITIKDLIGEDLMDFNISIKEALEGNDTITIRMEKNGYCKYLHYNLKENRPYTNLVEGVYFYSMHQKELGEFIGDKDFGKDFFDEKNRISIRNLEDSTILFSYDIDGKKRAFLGLTNLYVGLSYPIGFDLNRQEFVRFPINEFGLIDDSKMREVLSHEKLGLGFDKEIYEKVVQANTLYFKIRTLLGDDYIYDRVETIDRLEYKLAEYNYETTKMIKEKVDEKLYGDEKPKTK